MTGGGGTGFATRAATGGLGVVTTGLGVVTTGFGVVGMVDVLLARESTGRPVNVGLAASCLCG